MHVDSMLQSSSLVNPPRPCNGEELEPTPSSSTPLSTATKLQSNEPQEATFSDPVPFPFPSPSYPLPSLSHSLLLPSTADHISYAHILSVDETFSSKQSEIIPIKQSAATTTIEGGKSTGQDDAKTIILFVAVGVSLLCIIGIVFLLTGYIWLRRKKRQTFTKQSNFIITELLKNINPVLPLDVDIDSDSHLSKQLARVSQLETLMIDRTN